MLGRPSYCSDKYLTENRLWNINKLTPGDIILADRGIPGGFDCMEHMEKSTDTKVAVCKFLDFIPRYVP